MTISDAHSSSPDTLAVHAGVGSFQFGPVVPPIFQVSTFAFEDADHGARLFAGEDSGYIYSRMGNPTVEALEVALAALEGGYKTLACGSGMAAVHTVFASLLSAGDHVVCSDAVYGPTCTLLRSVMQKFGVEATMVDTSDVSAVQAAMQRNTRVVYVETPGNPTLVVSDIAAISRIANQHGAALVVDNTFMSPVLQKPLELGADMVIHSLTKFLNGHADVVGGAIIAKTAEQYDHLRKTLNHLGGVLPPMEAFLVHRGIKTLAVRMQRHCETGIKVARYLEAHPAIEWVRYPALQSHPQYAVAQRQSLGGGAVISFELKAGLEAGRRLMNSVKLCTLAVSLGGVESLIEHPASMTHASMGREARKQAHITDGLVRISVGIERAEDIIQDLEQALDLATGRIRSAGCACGCPREKESLEYAI